MNFAERCAEQTGGIGSFIHPLRHVPPPSPPLSIVCGSISATATGQCHPTPTLWGNHSVSSVCPPLLRWAGVGVGVGVSGCGWVWVWVWVCLRVGLCV